MDDDADEPDGSVTATVTAGPGYTVAPGLNRTATVAVTDDDELKPGVSIEGGALVIEGEAATFLLTATPPPAAPLTVEVTVTEGRDFVADGELDTRTVTIPTSGSATYTVRTGCGFWTTRTTSATRRSRRWRWRSRARRFPLWLQGRCAAGRHVDRRGRGAGGAYGGGRHQGDAAAGGSGGVARVHGVGRAVAAAHGRGGVRRDGGDADRGLGLDVGGVVVAHGRTGLSADVRVRLLLVHEAAGLRSGAWR